MFSFANALIVVGAVLGATLGWWFGHPLGILLGAHVAIGAGYLVEPTRRRGWLVAAALVLMWWPLWLGQWFWE